MTSQVTGRPVPQGRLTGAHALLLAQVTARAGELMAAAAEDRWPARELQALASCLRTQVLAQAAAEEALLFPAGQAGAGVARLNRDHARLRAGTDVLSRAARGEGTRSPAQLAAITRGLLSQLEQHLAAEHALLTAPATASG